MKQKPEFKQTEIGVIPVDWEETIIESVCNIKNGKTNSQDAVEDGKYPLFDRSSQIKKSNKFLFDCKAIIIPGEGKEFIPRYFEGKFDLHQRSYALWEKKRKVDLKFIYYWILKKRDYLARIAVGSTVRSLRFNHLQNFPLGLPTLPEQSAIAKILSDLDSKIELNQQMNKTLEAIGQAIFKRWFIDFEFPNEKGKPYKSFGGEMVFNEELGKYIPKGWEIKPLDEIAEYLNGLPLQKYPAGDGEEYLPVIKIKELRNGITDQTERAGLDIPEEYIIDDGDILFSWSGTLEVKIWTNGKGALNQHLFKVSSKNYPKWFYYYWTKHFLPKFRHIAKGKATTMGHIQRHNLKESEVIIPDKKTMEEIDKIIAPIIEKMIKINLESWNLRIIRDMLLPKLMSGKIRVPVEVRT